MQGHRLENASQKARAPFPGNHQTNGGYKTENKSPQKVLSAGAPDLASSTSKEEFILRFEGAKPTSQICIYDTPLA